MRKTLYLAMACLSLVMFSSCATLFTGTKDVIYFNSNPQGAKVFIDGIEVCRATPCQVSVKRTLGTKLAEIKLDDYQAKIVKLDKEFNAVTLLNILLGGLIGLGVDCATGSLMKYDPKFYNIEIEEALKGAKAQTIEIDTQKKEMAIYVQE